MSDFDRCVVDRPYSRLPETRDAARRRIEREPDAELLLMALGLVVDPAAEEKSLRKAQVNLRMGGAQ